MMPGSSSASWKSTGSGVVPDKFPAGLRVLVVDDDPTCLMIIEKMLKICKYEATVCNRAEIGLKLLRENKNGYDIVLSDVHMPDMDGLKFLEHIGLEMDLPVIMMSADDGNSVVMKGITHGACDYLIKPVRIEALRNIWQHVVRKRKKDFEPLATATSGDDVVDQHQKLPEDVDHSSSANEGHNWKNAKRRKDDEDEDEERDGSSSSKKPRVVWSVELHQQFVAAVNQLGIEKAVPKKILELMNIPGLSRENVASHLQKYRLYLRKLSESQHLGSINNPFMGSPDSGYGSISSLNGHQPMAIGGQLPGQSFSSLQAGILNQSKPQFPNPMTAINQRNLLNFQNTKSPHLLHGIPTNMEPKRLVDLHQSRQPVLMPMVGQSQSQSQSQSQIQSRQPVFANGMMTHGGIVPSYNMLNNSGFQDTNFNNGPYSSFKNMGPVGSFLPGDENGAHLNGLGNNQDDLLTAILKPQGSFGQLENEFVFDS